MYIYVYISPLKHMNYLLHTQHTLYMNSNSLTRIKVLLISSLFSGSYFTATPQSLCVLSSQEASQAFLQVLWLGSSSWG